MKKYALVIVGALALAAAPATAQEWGFVAGGFSGGLSGVGTSSSGAGTLSGGFEFGNATSTSESQAFGQAESAFGVGIGELPDGSDAGSAYGNFAGATVASGSMSNSMSATNGNGFAGSGTTGAGWGQTELSGSGGLIGGFISAGN